MTAVINLFGGPGTGKSTSTAQVFSELKSRGVNCEMALEYAKDKVWEESYRTLENQIYVFGHQHHRIHRLLGKVDAIVTDCPLLLSLYYGKGHGETFKRLVLEEHHKLNNVNVFLVRKKVFNPAGRLQNEEEAKEIDVALKQILVDNQIEHRVVLAEPWAVKVFADDVFKQITAPRTI